jgi:hypothetical protein
MSARANDTWVIDLGETRLSLNPDVTLPYGLWAEPIGDAALATVVEDRDRDVLIWLVDPGSDFSISIAENGAPLFEGSIRHVGGMTVGGPAGRRALQTFVLAGGRGSKRERFVAVDGGRGRAEGLILRGTRVHVDTVSRTLHITSDDVRLSPTWAAALSSPKLANMTIGTLVLRARLIPLDGEPPVEEVTAAPFAVGSAAGGGGIGPDIIVGVLPGMASYGTANGISAFAVATTSCNQGDEQALWIAGNNQHPVIGQNMYRLKDNRFEQIGMSWLKHGFFALQHDACRLGCQRWPNGAALGVGCSDPYSATLNGSQTLLGPRWQVNAFTGYFPYPPSRPPLTGSLIERRLQVHNVDLDPALNIGALYFVDGHYVTADDALAGNGANNMSYRPAVITGPFDSDPLYRAGTTGTTQRMQAAIQAWQDTDETVFEVKIPIPEEGTFILAAKATALGGGVWEYEYAVQNVDSDRSCGSFSVPLPPGANVIASGFHDVDYHSGEPFDGTDWPATVFNERITWATTRYTVNSNANALRWGTLYNFRFQVDAAPNAAIGGSDATVVTLGLFKPGSPTEVAARAIGPALDPVDCNENGIPDACDIDCNVLGCEPPFCGTSTDCDDTGIPDECEPQEDCNANGVIDACDISGGTSSDCNTNGVPDDCEADCDGDGIPDDCDTVEDCDTDGIEDCLDLCPCTSEPGACLCPPTGLCCFDAGFCLPDYPRGSCCALGATPDCPCEGSPCAAGCMPEEVNGDFDRDGDLDIADYGHLLSCFSGPVDQTGFTKPSDECRARFDFDVDTDIDLADHEKFQGRYAGSGPQ